MRHPQQPGAKGRVAAEARELVERAQERVLREVVRVLRADDAAHHTVHDVAVALDQLAVGVELTAPYAPYQLDVRIHF